MYCILGSERKASQPPVRIQRTDVQNSSLVKEGDVKMLVQKRWVRTHLELFATSLVLTYIDPGDNVTQVREEIPINRVKIAPNSPQAPSALKESSWRVKDYENEYHLMSNSKNEAAQWLTVIKNTRDGT